MPDEVFQSIATRELTVNSSTSGNIDLKGRVSVENVSGGAILNEAATSDNPSVIPNKADINTGIGLAGLDSLSIITGAFEAARFTELGGHILQTHEAQVAQTADAGSAQGGHPIVSTYTVFSTVGAAGDSCTLPATAPVGTICTIKNDAAANSMDIFPANGDNLGNGANTQQALAIDNSITYMCTVANATWTMINSTL